MMDVKNLRSDSKVREERHIPVTFLFCCFDDEAHLLSICRKYLRALHSRLMKNHFTNSLHQMTLK